MLHKSVTAAILPSLVLFAWVAEKSAADYVAVEYQRQPKSQAPSDSSTIPRVERRDIPTQPGLPEGEQRQVSREGKEYLQRLRRNTPFGARDFDLAALRAGMGTRREPKSKDIKLIRVKIKEIPCEWVIAPGADPDVRLLYLHGGGFVSGSGGFYLTLAAHISAAARCAVLLPDYRLAPEHPFPAGLDDCVAAHDWMIAHGPSGAAPARATFVAGDSAGGNLTLATLLALRQRKLRLPAGGIAISPVTDLTLASESLKTVDDPIISAKTMPVFREHYLGKKDPRDPLASPVFGDYRGLPPLLIQVGEHEMLRDDSVRAAKKARADGIAVKLEVWPGMFHVFQSHEPLLPEGKEAIEHIAGFMRSVTQTKEAIEVKPGQAKLFLDDHIIAKLEGLHRTMQQATKRGAVIHSPQPDRTLSTRSAPAWDPSKRLRSLSLLGIDATFWQSRDGLHWRPGRKPNLRTDLAASDPTDPDTGG